VDPHDRHVRLSIPAKAEYITLGRLALTAIARVRPLSAETLSDLKLALTEACTNSVRHAYREGRSGTDEGAGFQPGESARDGNGDLSEGGLGIAIIRAVADEVEIGERESGGSRLRFVKFLGD
jgi:serine/threonine-protein kinase RsbW